MSQAMANNKTRRVAGTVGARASLAVIALALSGCALQTAPGPSRSSIMKGETARVADGVQVVELTEAVATRLQALERQRLFSEDFPETAASGTIVDAGDILAVTIWEAPPAVLFGGTTSTGLLPTNAPSSGISLPDQVVANNGAIMVPFVGEVRARGRSGPQIAGEIVSRLGGKAHQPQAVVRIIKSGTAAATVVGEVTNTARIPLTPQGEKLLDALALTGGVKQPLEKTMIQLTRGNRVSTMPLSTVIADPRQNVVLQPGDVVAALYKPFSFTVLGATQKNEEVPFEATGITLSQALGRAGGLVDNRADPRGVFLFRMETKAALGLVLPGEPGSQDLLPTIYRIDLKDPGTYFLTQRFAVRDKDMIYVSNGSYVELQRFTQLLGSLIAPAATGVAILP